MAGVVSCPRAPSHCRTAGEHHWGGGGGGAATGFSGQLVPGGAGGGLRRRGGPSAAASAPPGPLRKPARCFWEEGAHPPGPAPGGRLRGGLLELQPSPLGALRRAPERPPLRSEPRALPLQVKIFGCRFPQEPLSFFRWCFWGSLGSFLALTHRRGVPKLRDGKSSVDVGFPALARTRVCTLTRSRKLSGNL